MIPGSANPLLLKSAAAAGGYQIERSLRFNSSDSAYLSRTPAVAGNRKTWTWAGWVKRGKLGGENQLFTAGSGNTFTYFSIGDNVADGLTFARYTGSHTFRVSTTQVLRDPSAWYHIFLAVDTSQATDTNRVKLYVNGIQVTVFTTASYPGQNTEYEINNTNDHRIGDRTGNYANSGQFDGYLADIHFIDGQALTPSSFTEVSATTGQLVPKAYTGTFTGNSFWLKFSDNSSTTSGSNIGIGKDFSGLGNYWNSTGLSVTAGAGNDSLVDTPTSYGTDTGAGGEVRGNYCTWNPLDTIGGNTFSNGNLDIQTVTAAYGTCRGTIGVSSGKWYWEIDVLDETGGGQIGIIDSVSPLPSEPYLAARGYVYLDFGSKGNNGSQASYGASYTTGDLIGVALDLDAGTLAFYKNGSSQGTAYSSLPSGTVFFPVIADYQSANSSKFALNAGQRAFAYQTPGTNRPAATFKALCDTNLTAPVVAKPNTVMDVLTYTGNGANRSISGLQFAPDFVWIKGRSFAGSHLLYNSVVGPGPNKAMQSDNTNAEGGAFMDNSTYGYLTSFDSTGFSVVPGSSPTYVNTNGSTYVAWTWDAGTSTVTNTQGSITSSVRANASAGFSIVTYTGTGSLATVGHGLGAAPSFIIVKARSTTYNWSCYHISTGKDYVLNLNTTGAGGSGANSWGTAAPTSTVFGVKDAGPENNGSGVNFVAYCFAPVAGYSSFGSYTGNGSADGPFVYTGFRPRWVLIKYSSGVQDWILWDAARTPYNAVTSYLLPSKSDAEDPSSIWLDFTSNGFKIRKFNSAVNANSGTYIYAAFAESPFQYARAR